MSFLHNENVKLRNCGGPYSKVQSKDFKHVTICLDLNFRKVTPVWRMKTEPAATVLLTVN